MRSLSEVVFTKVHPEGFGLLAPLFDNMGVNHNSFNIFVAKEFLNSSDVIAIFSVTHTCLRYKILYCLRKKKID